MRELIRNLNNIVKDLPPCWPVLGRMVPHPVLPGFILVHLAITFEEALGLLPVDTPHWARTLKASTPVIAPWVPLGDVSRVVALKVGSVIPKAGNPGLDIVTLGHRVEGVAWSEPLCLRNVWRSLRHGGSGHSRMCPERPRWSVRRHVVAPESGTLSVGHLKVLVDLGNNLRRSARHRR